MHPSSVSYINLVDLAGKHDHSTVMDLFARARCSLFNRGSELKRASDLCMVSHVVEPAGSEKLPKLCSGAVTGQRTQEESRCINRSLSQLNEVNGKVVISTEVTDTHSR